MVLFVLVLVLALLVPWLPAGQFAPGVPVSLQSFRYADAPALQLFASGEQVGFLNFLFEGLTGRAQLRRGRRDRAAANRGWFFRDG